MGSCGVTPLSRGEPAYGRGAVRRAEARTTVRFQLSPDDPKPGQIMSSTTYARCLRGIGRAWHAAVPPSTIRSGDHRPGIARARVQGPIHPELTAEAVFAETKHELTVGTLRVFCKQALGERVAAATSCPQPRPMFYVLLTRPP